MIDKAERCPDCDVDLDADATEVRCWRCGFTVRDVDNPLEYHDRYDEITDNR